MKQLLEQIKQALSWVGRNWYEIALTVVCFLVAVEILGTWACFGVLLVSFIVWGFKK